MKPFATLGSEISKVRDRVLRGAEALRPAKVANDVRDQRDRLLAKLGEQTFRLIAERKLQVPKVLQDSVEKLAALLGVQLPPAPSTVDDAAQSAESRAASMPIDYARSSRAIDPPEPNDLQDADDTADIDEPSVSDVREASPLPSKVSPTPKKPVKKASSAKKKQPPKKRAAKKSSRR